MPPDTSLGAQPVPGPLCAPLSLAEDSPFREAPRPPFPSSCYRLQPNQVGAAPKHQIVGRATAQSLLEHNGLEPPWCTCPLRFG